MPNSGGARPAPRLPPLNPAELHSTIAGWVHKTMVVARFVQVVGADGAAQPRVVCASPGFLFVCEEAGAVRRVVRVSQVESILTEAAQDGLQGDTVLVRCRRPEPDMLITQAPDGRNLAGDPESLPGAIAALAGGQSGALHIRRVTGAPGQLRRMARLAKSSEAPQSPPSRSQTRDSAFRSPTRLSSPQHNADELEPPTRGASSATPAPSTATRPWTRKAEGEAVSPPPARMPTMPAMPVTDLAAGLAAPPASAPAEKEGEPRMFAAFAMERSQRSLAASSPLPIVGGSAATTPAGLPMPSPPAWQRTTATVPPLPPPPTRPGCDVDEQAAAAPLPPTADPTPQQLAISPPTTDPPPLSTALAACSSEEPRPARPTDEIRSAGSTPPVRRVTLPPPPEQAEREGAMALAMALLQGQKKSSLSPVRPPGLRGDLIDTGRSPDVSNARSRTLSPSARSGSCGPFGSTTPPSYLRWLEEQRARGARLCSELVALSAYDADAAPPPPASRASAGAVAAAATLQPYPQHGMAAVGGAGTTTRTLSPHAADTSGGGYHAGPPTPPNSPAIPAASAEEEAAWQEFDRLLRERGAVPELLRGASDEAVAAAISSVGLTPRRAAAARRQWARFKGAPQGGEAQTFIQSVGEGSPQWAALESLLADFLPPCGPIEKDELLSVDAIVCREAEAVLLERRAELDNPSSPSTQLWHAAPPAVVASVAAGRALLQPESSPVPGSQLCVRFPASQPDPAVFARGTHRLMLVEVALGNCRAVDKPQAGDAEAEEEVAAHIAEADSVLLQGEPAEYVVPDGRQALARFIVTFRRYVCPVGAEAPRPSVVQAVATAEDGSTALAESARARAADLGRLAADVDSAICAVQSHGEDQLHELDRQAELLKQELSTRRDDTAAELRGASSAAVTTLLSARGLTLALAQRLRDAVSGLADALKSTDAERVLRARAVLCAALVAAEGSTVRVPTGLPQPRIRSQPLEPAYLQLESCPAPLSLPRRISVESSELRTEPPQRGSRPTGSTTRVFKYVHDGDDGGLMWYLGTRGGKELFRDPHSRGEVTVSCSAGWDERSGGGAAQLVDASPGSFVLTTECRGGCVSVDLGPSRSLSPSAYTLTHGIQNSDALALRDWVFEACDNDERWAVLAVHRGDTSLGSWGKHTWMLADTGRSFRRFRLRQTGPTAGGSSWAICLGGIELYGTLTELQ